MEDMEFRAVDRQVLLAIRVLGRNRARELLVQTVVLEHVDNALQVHEGIVDNLHLRR